MKRMTNAQIDELNMLLVEHGAALTAFYKEGMDQGARNVIKGIPIGIGIVIGVQVIGAIIKRYKKTKLKRNRSRQYSGSFSFCPLHRPS